MIMNLIISSLLSEHDEIDTGILQSYYGISFPIQHEDDIELFEAEPYWITPAGRFVSQSPLTDICEETGETFFDTLVKKTQEMMVDLGTPNIFPDLQSYHIHYTSNTEERDSHLMGVACVAQYLENNPVELLNLKVWNPYLNRFVSYKPKYEISGESAFYYFCGLIPCLSGTSSPEESQKFLEELIYRFKSLKELSSVMDISFQLQLLQEFVSNDPTIRKSTGGKLRHTELNSLLVEEGSEVDENFDEDEELIIDFLRQGIQDVIESNDEFVDEREEDDDFEELNDVFSTKFDGFDNVDTSELFGTSMEADADSSVTSTFLPSPQIHKVGKDTGIGNITDLSKTIILSSSVREIQKAFSIGRSEKDNDIGTKMALSYLRGIISRLPTDDERGISYHVASVLSTWGNNVVKTINQLQNQPNDYWKLDLDEIQLFFHQLFAMSEMVNGGRNRTVLAAAAGSGKSLACIGVASLLKSPVNVLFYPPTISGNLSLQWSRMIRRHLSGSQIVYLNSDNDLSEERRDNVGPFIQCKGIPVFDNENVEVVDYLNETPRKREISSWNDLIDDTKPTWVMIPYSRLSIAGDEEVQSLKKLIEITTLTISDEVHMTSSRNTALEYAADNEVQEWFVRSTDSNRGNNFKTLMRHGVHCNPEFKILGLSGTLSNHGEAPEYSNSIGNCLGTVFTGMPQGKITSAAINWAHSLVLRYTISIPSTNIPPIGFPDLKVERYDELLLKSDAHIFVPMSDGVRQNQRAWC